MQSLQAWPSRVGYILTLQQTIQAYQKAAIDTKEFKLRQLELITVACHNIAACIYQEVKGD
jgi:hypothetical protein